MSKKIQPEVEVAEREKVQPGKNEKNKWIMIT